MNRLTFSVKRRLSHEFVRQVLVGEELLNNLGTEREDYVRRLCRVTETEPTIENCVALNATLEDFRLEGDVREYALALIHRLTDNEDVQAALVDYYCP